MPSSRLSVAPVGQTFWKGASELLKSYFGNISLRDLVEIAEKKKKKTKEKAKSKAR